MVAGLASQRMLGSKCGCPSAVRTSETDTAASVSREAAWAFGVSALPNCRSQPRPATQSQRPASRGHRGRPLGADDERFRPVDTSAEGVACAQRSPEAPVTCSDARR